MGASLGKLNWALVLIYFIPYFVVILLKVTRWKLLFYPLKTIKYQRLFSSLMISYLWNTVLPARLGEVVRGYVVSRSEKIGVARVFSTILLEKILDIITMMLFLLALLPFLKIDDNIRQPALILGGGVILAFMACLLMAARRREADRFFNFFLNRLPLKLRNNLHSYVTDILDTLTVLLNFKISLNLWFQSILMWAINTTLYLLIAWAVGLNLTFEQGVLVLITSNLGMAVPSSPGNVGTFELVIKVTLLPFFPGQESLILTFALLEHVIAFLPVVLLGAFYSWREGLAPGKVEDEKVKKRKLQEETGLAGEPTPNPEASLVAGGPPRPK